MNPVAPRCGRSNSSFILHPSSFILHPSSFILHPSSFILALPPEFAKIADQAGRTCRLARDTYVTPVQDQPMVRILAEFLRDEFHQLVLDFEDVFAGGDAGPVGDAEDM